MAELPERTGFTPPAQKNFDAIKDRLTTASDSIDELSALACARAYRNGAASYNTGSVVVFDTLSWGTASTFNTSTGEFTVPTAGIYHIDAQVRSNIVITADVYWSVQIVKNGTIIAEGASGFQRGAANGVAGAISAKHSLAAADVITIKLSHGTGGAAAVLVGSNYTWFDICYVTTAP